MEPRVRVVPATATSHFTSSSRAVGSALRVLVVDDNADAAYSLKLLIQRKGSAVEMAYDGAEALRIADDFRPHVVLLDLGLPGMDGCEVARAMRRTAWGREVTLIAVTGSGEDGDRERCHEAGFDRHFLKPIHPPVLLRLLAKLAEGHQAAPR